METWIVPSLRQAEKLNQFKSLKYQWNHRGAVLSWSLVSVTALGLLLILISQLKL